MLIFKNSNDFFDTPSYPTKNKKIHYYNDFGQDIYINIHDWVKFELPNEIEQAIGSQSKLFNLLLFCYNNGVSKHVLNNVDDLLKNDPFNVDFLVLSTNIYISCKEYKKALNLINKALSSCPDNGILLTTLAKIHYRLGDIELAKKYLLDGLNNNPNQEDALITYCNILSEDDYSLCLEKLNTLANFENSITPSLLLANLALLQNNLDEALNIYFKLLNTWENNDYILSSISRDLNKFAHYYELISIIEPRYDFYKMPHIIGLNLLTSYAFCKSYKKGDILLHKFMELNNPCYLNYLLNISSLLDMFKPNPKEVPLSSECKYTITVFDTPIWYYSLGNPEWILNSRPKLATIGILPFANFSNSKINNLNIYYEDNTSRLARSLPLYIGEKIHYETNFDFNYLLPLSIPHGPIIKKSTYSEKYLNDIAIKNNTPILIFGTVDKNGKKYLFNINVYNSVTKKLKVFPFSANLKTFGKNINSMISEALSCINNIKFYKSVIYTSPANDQLYNYLQLLSYSLTQTLISNKLLNITSILGERNIINSYFNYALNNNDYISKLLLLSGLSKSKSYNKTLYLEPKNKIIKYFTENNLLLDKNILPLIDNIYVLQKEQKQ